tara:strand:- start:439 stop:1011 length:573 start_codon:yes stop_codon:yes gene_type:complete
MIDKQLEISFSNVVNNKKYSKDKILNFIKNNEYTKDQIDFIYENLRLTTERFKPLQRREGHVYFIYRGKAMDTLKIHKNDGHYYLKNVECNEKNARMFKIGKSCNVNVINRVSEQIDKTKTNQIVAISNPMSYETYSKLELDLHAKYIKNRAFGRRSEEFIGLTDDEINDIKNILGGNVSVKALQAWQCK